MIRKRKEISADELSRALDYKIGDIVQIRADGLPCSGRLGEIIGISLYKSRADREDALSYSIKLSDNESFACTCHRLRLVRAAGKVAVIIGINFIEGKQGNSHLIYELKLSDKQSISLRGNQIKFVKHGDDIKT